MEKYLLHLLMRHDFYVANKNKFISEYFPGNLQNLYSLLVETQNKTDKDISVDDIKALYKVTYPATTTAQWDLIEQVLDTIPGEIQEDVSKEVLQKAFILEQGRQIAAIGIEICNGKEADIQKVRAILQKIDTGVISYGEDDFEPVSSELEAILEEVKLTTKWPFYLAPLQTVASGLGNGIFTIISARTEAGKSAMAISLMAAPGGFAEQGAKISYLANEEPPQRLQARAVMCYTGMPLQELYLDTDKAKAMYHPIKEQIKFFQARDKSIYDVEAHAKKHSPDIIIIDQLDKISIRGTYAREDERLGALYATARDIAVKHNAAVIAITQLNAESEGKTYISSANLSGARTSKAAEADLLIGVGKSPAHSEYTRVLNIIKNKITSNHQEIVCLLRPEISRYVA